MEKIKDAGVKHVIFGLAVTMVSDANLSQTDLVKSIKILSEEPYIEIKSVEKWKDVYESM